MPWWVYSVEGFPSKTCPTEYVKVLGHQVILKAGQWVALQARYINKRYSDFMDKEGRSDQHLDFEVAEKITEFYGRRGVIAHEFTKAGPDEAPNVKKKLEAEAAEINKKWAKSVVETFERIVRKATASGYGRLDPSDYELEQYEKLGLPAPDSVEAFKLTRTPQPVQVNMPDMSQMFAMFLKMIGTLDDDTLTKLRAGKVKPAEVAAMVPGADGEIPVKVKTVFDEDLKNETEPIPGESIGTGAPVAQETPAMALGTQE